MDFKRTFAYHHPEMVKEWSKDNDLQPDEVTKSSAKKVKWQCSTCAHEWAASVNNRRNGKGCPNCNNTRTLTKGKNDLLTTHPRIAQIWSEKNTTSPNELSIWSKRKAILSLPCGHERIVAPRHIRAILEDDSHPLEDICLHCKNSDRKLSAVSPDLRDEYADVNDCDFNDLSYNSAKVITWECIKHDTPHQWDAPVYQRVNSRTHCPKCALADKVSMPEKEIREYLEQILDGDEIIVNDRTVLDGKELDLYIPSKMFAIEYNGLYWHSEDAGKGRKYHYDKWSSCQEKGIRLLTIWEDDWSTQKDLVKNMIAHKIGSSHQRRVYARKATLRVASFSESEAFCNKNHIQGGVQGTFYLALVDESSEIIAVSVWTKRRNVLYLERYCTSCIVIGGLGKMLKYAIDWSKENGVDAISTFSDHAVSNGDVYEKLGFEEEKSIRPDYMYIVKEQRRHKFNYRIKRFKTDPSLQYADGLSERELALLNKIPRVWDAGKTKWTLHIA